MRRLNSRQERQGRKHAKAYKKWHTHPYFKKSSWRACVLGALGEKIVRRMPKQG